MPGLCTSQLALVGLVVVGQLVVLAGLLRRRQRGPVLVRLDQLQLRLWAVLQMLGQFGFLVRGRIVMLGPAQG
jgi:hypothetical protein